MSNVAIQQPATINSALQNLSKALEPLLEKNTQHFMAQFENRYIQPTIEISNQSIIVHKSPDKKDEEKEEQSNHKTYCIIIHNMPENLTRDDIDHSFIGRICHKVKHLYSDGDSAGRRTAHSKLRNKKPLENNSIRMCITYVYFLRKSDNGQDVEIQFFPSFTEPPKFIEKFQRGEISGSKLAELWNDDRIISIEEEIVAWRKMTEAELDTHINAFVGACYTEIRERFDWMYRNCINIPNYSTPIEFLEATAIGA